MNTKTDAIVLCLAPHNEKASVLHLYTRSHGRMQYLVYGRHSRNKKGIQALLEPLSVLHIEGVQRDTNGLGRLSECSLAYVPTRLLSDHTRRCVALFIAEVLYRTLSHPQQDEILFDFLVETVRELDQCPDPQNTHIRFLVRYAEQLGFAIDHADPDNQPLTLLEGNRKQHLHALMDYYRAHVPNFTVPNSLPVLEAVFD
ncbi:MAG: DNA repair protein RecO [Paludibacteraceae bacterium]|nr:DNA repair protein RecO [Paludibacteraceae bacterium]